MTAMVLLSFKAVLRRYKRQVLSFRHTFHSLLSYIFAILFTSLYHQTSHANPLATCNMTAGPSGIIYGFKDQLPVPSWRRAGGLVKLLSTSVTALATEIVNLKIMSLFLCGLRKGMLTCNTLAKIRGEEKKRKTRYQFVSWLKNYPTQSSSQKH